MKPNKTLGKQLNQLEEDIRTKQKNVINVSRQIMMRISAMMFVLKFFKMRKKGHKKIAHKMLTNKWKITLETFMTFFQLGGQ